MMMYEEVRIMREVEGEVLFDVYLGRYYPDEDFVQTLLLVTGTRVIEISSPIADIRFPETVYTGLKELRGTAIRRIQPTESEALGGGEGIYLAQGVFIETSTGDQLVAFSSRPDFRYSGPDSEGNEDSLIHLNEFPHSDLELEIGEGKAWTPSSPYGRAE